MALNYYEVEIKAAALTSHDLSYTQNHSLRIFSGLIISSNKYCTMYTLGTQVLCYMPSHLLQLRKTDDEIIATVPEEYIIAKPNELGYEHCVLGVASIFRTLNALHYTLSVLQNETILILQATDAVPLQIALGLGLTVFYTSKEDYKVKATRLVDLPDSIISETGGLGVNYILDFSSRHDSKSKKIAIDCLAIRGKWAVCDQNLQLDPPESFQMFMRNSTLCWCNEDIWMHSGSEHGKFLHLLNLALRYTRDGVEPRANKSFLLSEIELAYLEKCDLILLKSI